MARRRANPDAPRRARLDLRLEAELLDAVQRRVAEQRYRSAGEYVRALVRRDLGSVDGSSGEPNLERVLAGVQERLLTSLRRIQVVQRASHALLDSFAKAALTYLPEAAAAAGETSRARGKARYDRVVRAAEAASADLLDQLITHVEREIAKRERAAEM